MIRVYITTVSEAVSDGAEKRLSEYRRAKLPRKNGAVSLAAGLLLDYALRGYGLYECDMEYRENEHGKPFFKNCTDIKFNLSHSGEYAVCAISDDGESSAGIGIDAEKNRDTKNALKIAERYFTPAEYEYVKNSGDTKTTFFKLWTRKESLLKAIGTGISGGLGAYEVLCDEITVGDTKFCFSQIRGYENMSITLCAEEKEFDVKFVKNTDFKKISP